MKADLAKSLRSGKRSMFRLPVKGEKPCSYREGRPYVVKSATEDTPAEYITITEVREQALGEITLREVKREGYPSNASGLEEFREDWKAQHRKYSSKQRVWVIGFIPGDQSDTLRIPAARPGSHYVSLPALGLSGAAPEVSEDYQGVFSSAAQNARRSGLCARREKLLALVAIVRLEVAKQNIGSSTARRRLKTVEHNLRALEREARRVA